MTSSDANARQVGGSHYKGEGTQHWDMVAGAGLGYFPAQITRYLCRYRLKNGQQDMQKAIHYTEKMAELVAAGKLDVRQLGWQERSVVLMFCCSNELTREERMLILYAASARTVDELNELLVRMREVEFSEEKDKNPFDYMAGERLGNKSVFGPHRVEEFSPALPPDPFGYINPKGHGSITGGP